MKKEEWKEITDNGRITMAILLVIAIALLGIVMVSGIAEAAFMWNWGGPSLLPEIWEKKWVSAGTIGGFVTGSTFVVAVVHYYWWFFTAPVKRLRPVGIYCATCPSSGRVFCPKKMAEDLNFLVAVATANHV